MDKEQLVGLGASEKAAHAATLRKLSFSDLAKLYDVVQQYAPELRGILDEIVSLGPTLVSFPGLVSLLAIVAAHAPDLSAFVGELIVAAAPMWHAKLKGIDGLPGTR